MKKLFISGVITATIIAVAAVIFYACNKETKMSGNTDECLIQKQVTGYTGECICGGGVGGAETTKYYIEKDCTTKDGKPGTICENTLYKPTKSCSSGHPCEATSISSVIGYFGDDIVRYETPNLYNPNTLRITAEILRNHNTHKPIMLYSAKFDVVNANHVVKASWCMTFSLTSPATHEIQNAIDEGNMETLHEIVSNMNSYNMYVCGTLLTPTFSKTIVVDGETITIDYNHIQGVIWNYLVAILD